MDDVLESGISRQDRASHAHERAVGLSRPPRAAAVDCILELFVDPVDRLQIGAEPSQNTGGRFYCVVGTQQNRPPVFPLCSTESLVKT